MAAIEPIDLSARAALPRRSRFSGLLSVSLPDRLALAALGLVTFIAVLAPVLAPHDPRRQVGTPYASPSSAFPLGTDEAGRDMLSRVLLGVQTTWLTALLIIAIGVLIGGAVGLIAGAAGGLVDSGLMRITDLFLAMPAAVLAISVVAAMGPSLTHIVIAVSILWWPYYARLIRIQVRDLAARPHLEAARLAGVSADASFSVTSSRRGAGRDRRGEPRHGRRDRVCWPVSPSSASALRRRAQSWAP